jgi:hypothetical protein
MPVARPKEEVTVNRHPDSMMTPAQIARRIFKSSLPRKPQNRKMSAMEALGETFTLFDRFRNVVAEQGQNADETVLAALAYWLPESDPATVAQIRWLPNPSGVAAFSKDVMALPQPAFLGAVFVQVDPDAEKDAYKAVSFCVPFVGGDEEAGRLLVAQRMLLLKLQETTKRVKRSR